MSTTRHLWTTLAALTLVATGCSSSSDDERGPASGPGAAASPVGVVVDSGSDEPLRVGVVVSLRSPAGEGQDWLEGAEGARAAAYRLTAGGGSVDLEVIDDSGTANGAITAVEQLVESGVSGIVMATGGRHVQGALEASAAANVAILLPYYRSQTALPDNAFRTGPNEAAVAAALLSALDTQALAKPFVLTADGVTADDVGSADALAYRGRNIEKLVRRITASRSNGTIDSVVIAASATTQAEISSALRGRVKDLPILLTPEAMTPTFGDSLEADAGTIASRLASAGVDASDTTTMTSTPAADAVAAYFAALRLAAGDPKVTDLFGDASFAAAAGAADTASHDAVMAVAAAAAAAGSADPTAVLAAFDGLTVDAADGLAGPALDFSASDALSGDDVVALLATVQDPGVRPPSVDSDPRLFWFALEPASG